ncbi:MAG: hypothetical protein HY728_00630 [Candidatus Rokubacteria bacterium]|nr:hypothetical protein [Candidatus Rokubacteria bacterium]
MQVFAVSTPQAPGWRWRIINYAGEMVEESRGTFPSIGSAVAEGGKRLQEINVPDLSVRVNPYRRSTSYLRGR